MLTENLGRFVGRLALVSSHASLIDAHMSLDRLELLRVREHSLDSVLSISCLITHSKTARTIGQA